MSGFFWFGGAAENPDSAGAAAPSVAQWTVPNPEAPERALALSTHTYPIQLTLIGQDRFFGAAGHGPNYDWPNPGVPQRALVLRGHLRPTDVNLLLGKDLFFGAAGQGPSFDWPNPRAPQRALSLISHISAPGVLLLPSEAPVGLANFVLPQAVPRADALRGHIGVPGSLLLPSGSPVGFANLVLPNVSLRQSTGSQLDREPLNLNLASPPAPVSSFDWPNPRQPIQLQGHVHATDLSLLNAVAAAPIRPIDWQNPIAPLRITGGFANLGLAAEALPSFDWPNPLRVPPMRQAIAAGIPAPIIALQQPAPVRPIVWPNPRRAEPSLAVENLGSIRINLHGQDTFFGPSGKGPNYDWPNPRPLPREQSQTVSTNLPIIVPPPDPFPSRDWPNPRPIPRNYAGPQTGFVTPVNRALIAGPRSKIKYFNGSNWVPVT